MDLRDIFRIIRRRGWIIVVVGLVAALAEALGGLPPIKMHCSLLAEQALKSAIDDYLTKKAKA